MMPRLFARHFADAFDAARFDFDARAFFFFFFCSFIFFFAILIFYVDDFDAFWLCHFFFAIFTIFSHAFDALLPFFFHAAAFRLFLFSRMMLFRLFDVFILSTRTTRWCDFFWCATSLLRHYFDAITMSFRRRYHSWWCRWYSMLDAVAWYFAWSFFLPDSSRFFPMLSMFAFFFFRFDWFWRRFFLWRWFAWCPRLCLMPAPACLIFFFFFRHACRHFFFAFRSSSMPLCCLRFWRPFSLIRLMPFWRCAFSMSPDAALYVPPLLYAFSQTVFLLLFSMIFRPPRASCFFFSLLSMAFARFRFAPDVFARRALPCRAVRHTRYFDDWRPSFSLFSPPDVLFHGAMPFLSPLMLRHAFPCPSCLSMSISYFICFSSFSPTPITISPLSPRPRRLRYASMLRDVSLLMPADASWLFNYYAIDLLHVFVFFFFHDSAACHARYDVRDYSSIFIHARHHLLIHLYLRHRCCCYALCGAGVTASLKYSR